MGLNSGTVLAFINQPESRASVRRHLINFASVIYALFKLWIKFHARGKRNQTIKAVFSLGRFEVHSTVSECHTEETELLDRLWHWESGDPSSRPAGGLQASQKPLAFSVLT